MTGPVTALGIRNGDPAVLRALIARRGSAVLAYCERACAAAQVPAAAAEAFAKFRAVVVAAPRPAELDPEAALLSATRHAAAERAPHAQPSGAGAGLGRLLGGRPAVDHVDLVPELLIARADGTLDEEGEEQLNRLLDGSAAARAAEERFRAAEYAYRTAPPRTIPADVVEQIVTAMASVPAPDDPAEAPAPEPEAEPVLADPGPAAQFDHVGAEELAADEPAPAEEPAAEPPAPAADEAAAEQPAPAAEEAAPAAEEAAPAAEEAAPAVEEAAPAAEEAAPAVEEAAPSVGRAAAAVEAAAAAEAAGRSGGDDSANGAYAAATAEEEPDIDPREEWDVPPEEPGDREGLDVEIAAARLRKVTDDDLAELEDEDEEAAHLQTASGAVDEALVEEEALADEAEADDEAPPPPAHPRATPTFRPSGPPPPVGRASLPGRNALAPAAAVVAIAGVSILAYSGVFGGNEPQDPVDTGIAEKRSLVEVPEGEAAAVIDELRRAAAEARRQRLADRRGVVAVAPIPEPAEPEPEPPAAPPADDESAPAPEADEEPGDSGGEEAPPPEDEAPADADAEATG